MSRRETVVYHQVTEETSLFTTSSTINVADPAVDHVIISQKKSIYAAITLADIFQKVVYTTIITSLVLYLSIYLQSGTKYAIVGYFIFSCSSWFTSATVNLLDDFLPKKSAIMMGFAFFISGVALLSGLSHYMLDIDVLKYVIVVPLYFICLGESLCKTLIGDFGHKQFSKTQFPEQLQVYTDKLYWLGHLGALFLIAFLLGIAEFASFEVTYGLCCVSLAAGIVSFMIGWSKFAKQDDPRKDSIKLLYLLIKESRKVKKELFQRSKR